MVNFIPIIRWHTLREMEKVIVNNESVDIQSSVKTEPPYCILEVPGFKNYIPTFRANTEIVVLSLQTPWTALQIFPKLR